jgi:hypothetical protein
MRFLTRILLCCVFAVGVASAQRGGGARGGGGGFRGGAVGGGFRGGAGIGGGFRGGFGGYGGYGGFRGGYGYYGRGFYGGWGWGWGWPYWGLGFDLGYWPYYYPGYYPSYYPAYPYYSDPGYGYGYGGGYASYQPSPNVTVVYPNQGYAYPNTAVLRQYDEYGQEVQSAPATGRAYSGSPIYLIAFNDKVIRAAAAYWVDGSTLHYVTLEHEERQAPLNTVDRSLSLQLNSERRIPFQLPAQ